MEKYKLAIFPLFVGLGLLCYSWFLSYPLSIDYPNDVIFNHLSYYYWIGLPLILSSLFIICVYCDNHLVKASSCAGIVLAIFSLTFFYSSTPTSDSQYFRGLTEYFINTRNLDASQASHTYFQWPSYFLLGYIVNAVTGLSVVNAEFLFYAILGILLSITLYIYASLNFNKTGFLAVIGFFVSMFYFLNYQWVPFTLALTLLIILLMLEASEKWQEKYKSSVVPTMAILFFCISLSHLFAALFFVLYLLVRMIITRKKQYVSLFFLCISIYFLIQLTLAINSLNKNVQNIFRLPSEFSALASYTFNPVSIPLDIMAQNISRIVTISFMLMCVIGFTFMFFKRKLRIIDVVIFLVGAIYTGLGVFLFLLGNRGLPIAFIPVALGIAYLFRTKLKPYLVGVILVLLLLFVSIPIHTTFNTYTGSFVPFQTQEEFSAESFMLNYYDWKSPSVILAHSSPVTYLQSNIDSRNSPVTFQTEFSHNFPRITSDCILFTIGIENNFLAANYSVQQIINENSFSVCYFGGNSIIALRK